MATREDILRPKDCANETRNERKCEKSIGRFSRIYLLVLCFVIITEGFLFVDALEHRHRDSINFNQHSVIEPRLVHAKHKRAIENTLEKNGSHATHIHLIYEHNNEDVILDLHLSDNLIPIEHFISYQQPNGDKAIKNFTKTDIDLCNYQGKIRHKPDSTVALSTCDGIRGVVFDGHDTYYIENNSHGPDRKHFLIRHSDLKHDHKCGYEGGINQTHDAPLFDTTEFNRILRYKRSADGIQVRGPYNGNKRSSYVELVLVVDNKVFKALDKNYTKVHQHCKDIANIINALYVPLNIFVALLGVVIWSEQNLADLSSDGDKTLRSFLNYRKKYLVKEHPNDNAQLLTGEVFEGGVVGKALKGPICTFEFSGGVSMDHSKVVAIVATTIAHEMGHNFGMEHDTDDCNCPDDRCIMSSSSSSIAPTHWSSCSIDQLNLAFHHGMNYCLKNKPTKLFDSPVCGNGFVEPGEQCDCGLPQHCNNSCCNPNTCMLYGNASCATGSCCDLTTCKPHMAGTVCREAYGECDLPEYCTGEQEYCPSDVFKRDTEECDNSKAYCYQGSCRSHNDQCKVLWGPSGASSDQCYDKNTNGSRHGNCGYDRIKQEYISCKHDDALCGMLQCRHLNERLEFGMESVAILSHSFMNYRGSIVPCRTAIVDLGLQSIDPGLTPDGAKCGDDKMCVKQKCLTIESLKVAGKVLDCPDCNGNGVCNSKGHCHCFDGWAPPFCNEPGFGGSPDSGPASDPDSGRLFNRIMYIFFIGVVPCCTLFALFIYYLRQNNFQLMRKSPSLPNPKIKHHITKGSGSPQSPTFAPSSPNSPDDMNSSLLRPSSDVENNYIFGKFKGFTLKPLPSANKINDKTPKVAYVHPVTKANNEVDLHIVPTREAPPPPVTKKGVNAAIDKFNHLNESSAPPALPPLNKGSTARPIISHPVLEASTCDAKEVPSIVKYPTIRPAPAPPKGAPKAVILDETVVPEVLINPTSSNVEKKPKDGTLSRIQSFLKKDPNTKGEKVHKQLKPFDKDKLKDLQISSPILITQVSLNDVCDDEKKNKINRAQSMRDPPSPPVAKPTLNSFGSMRQPRPKSIVDRPTIPPPPRPPAPVVMPPSVKSPVKSPIKSPSNEYDDCESREQGTPDNIYSVIEESPKSPSIGRVTQQGSIESMGLLSEIVNEIEHRNFDSIYIASTLKKKKPADVYANAKPVEDEYSGDAGSTTSSGYMRPIGAPIARIPPSQSVNKLPSSTSNNSMSSFKSAKSSSVTSPEAKVIKFDGPMKKSNSDLSKKTASKDSEGGYKTPSNKPVDDKKESTISPRRPSLKKTVTPPSINLTKKTNPIINARKRSPSPTKPVASVTKVPSKPKTLQKPATVSKAPTTISAKPSLKTSTSLSNGGVKSSAAPSNLTANKVLIAAANKKSNVAALQQKFESTDS